MTLFPPFSMVKDAMESVYITTA